MKFKIKPKITKEQFKEYFRLFKHKHRLVIMDSETYQERWSFQLSGLNTFIVGGVCIIGLILLTSILIAFTPLRQYIPGYTRDELVHQAYENSTKVDSLQMLLSQQRLMLENIKIVLSGEDIPSVDFVSQKKIADTNRGVKDASYSHSKADSLLRKEIEGQDKYELPHASQSDYVEENTILSTPLKNYFFFTPVKGEVINGYNFSKRHLGIDIATKQNESVKAVLNGTVVFSDWTVESGYVITIQHPQNIISVYKHNSALLKKTGDIVRAGEPIAFTGNSGELTSGPHLHFELWYNGNPVNPREYISF